MRPILLILAASLVFSGCDHEFDIDTEAPPPPQGIRTISLDNAVELQWLESQAEDIKGYRVWVSESYDGRYSLIGSIYSANFIDYDAVNGVTSYYAVSAYDYDNNESELSKEVIYDTPRPEGYGVVLSNYQFSPNVAGYNFSQYTVLRFNDEDADLFFENINGRCVVSVWDDSDIQDMGYTNSLDDISYAPAQGWAPSKTAEAVIGHTYIIWTWDDHYAKIRVREADISRLVFDWAYQTAKANPELKITRPSTTERKPLERKLHLK